MEKHENNKKDEIEEDDDEDLGIKYNDLLDNARKYIDERNHKIAEFYVALAHLEPNLDILSKIKSIGILSFVRQNFKDSQIMDHLIFKIIKYRNQNNIRTFEFNHIFCMIRVLYRGALVKINDSDVLMALYFLKMAQALFEEGRIYNEQTSKETIEKLLIETEEKFRDEVIAMKEKYTENRGSFARILKILKNEKSLNIETSPDNRLKKYYLISVKWVKLALPFLEEVSNTSSTIKLDELFSLNKIFSKFLQILEKQNSTKIITPAFPGSINNHDIVEYKDFWYDYDENHAHTNIYKAENARENQDFFYINNEEWEVIKGIFGCSLEIPRYSLKSTPSMIDANLSKLRILILNKQLKERSIDYIRPRYIQISKEDTVLDLKEKVKRCLKDHFLVKLKSENNNFNCNFKSVKIYNILFGMKKRRREILKLIYSYSTQNKNYFISGSEIENDETTIDDLEYGPGDLLIAEVDEEYIKLIGKEIDCNYCSKKISIQVAMICDSCKNIFYCSSNCKKNDVHHNDYHNRFNKFHIKKFSLKVLFNTRLEDILDTSNSRLGKVGLRNLGNTCFMNSALQCLSHCEELTKFFLLKYYENDINSRSNYGSGGQIASSYYDLIYNLWNCNSDFLSPGEFRHMLIKIVKKFQGFSQQDSHEYLTYLLDSLHEDMNRNLSKPYIEMKEKEANESDSEASKRWWENHLKRENSIIVDLFHGQYKSTIMCPQCSKISITYDPFMYLGLPIPANQNKIYLKYFPNIFKEQEYKYHEFEFPLSSHKSITTKDIKHYVHHKNITNNIQITDYPTYLRLYDVVALSKEKLFKRVLKEDEEILSVIEKEGEIIVYEKFFNAKQLDNKNFFTFYINPIFFKEESSLIFFNKTTRNSLYYPLLLTMNKENKIKNIYFEIFKILRSSLKDIRNTDINKFYECKANNQLDYLNKEFDLFFKVEKYEKIDFEDVNIPFDLYFLNNIPEPTGFFSSKISCEFCEEKNCEFCKLTNSFDSNQNISIIASRIKTQRPICILVNIRNPQKCRFFNNDIFPFNLEEVSNKSLIHKSSRITLNDCLNLFRSEEKLEKENSWYCSNCKKHQEATKTMDIYRAPNILIIQLKRFRIKSTNSIIGMIRNGKNDTTVYYPLEGLNLKDYIVGDESDTIYDLFAISQHFGGMSSGHYTALCKNNNIWYDFDDESVSQYDEKSVVNSAAYLLFYRKRQPN